MINSYYNQVFTWSTQSGVNEYGDHSFSAPKSVKGRLQLKKQVIKDDNGEDITADGILYTDESHNILVHDKILYTDSTGTERRFQVVDIYEVYNKTRIHHKKILLQYAQV